MLGLYVITLHTFPPSLQSTHFSFGTLLVQKTLITNHSREQPTHAQHTQYTAHNTQITCDFNCIF